MKITCQSCSAKYTIADEKVAGKTVKIKCKKCGATIVVNGAEAGYQAAADPGYGQQAPPHDDHAAGAGGEEGEGATHVFGADQAAQQGGAPAGGDWTVNVADDDQRTMSSAQIAEAFASGIVTNDTYVWRDGMGDWSPLSGVAELVALVSRPAPAAAAPRPMAAAAPMAAAGGGLGGAVVANEPAPVAAAAPVAARRAAARPEKGDLFQAREQAAPVASAAPPPPPKAGAVGERNENSMLFSISALTAAKEARDKEKGPQKNGGRTAVDDIMNLGGGAAPILAPPPLLAPIVEPPPMPAPVAPMAAPGMGAMPQAQMGAMPGYGAAPMDDPFARKKSPVGLIIGIVAGLAVVGGVAAFFLTRPDSSGTTGTEQASVSASASVAPTPSAAPTTVAASASVATTADAVETAAPAGSQAGAASGTQPKTGVGAPVGGGPATPATKASAAPAASAAPVASVKPAETAAPTPPAADGAEFNRGAATSALGAAAGAARGCKKPDGPTGSGKVKVTFAPSGNVTSATVDGPPFAGTPVGGCIASAFRSAKVPPFSGAPVSVSKTVTIN